jgi:hypothetical protein
VLSIFKKYLKREVCNFDSLKATSNNTVHSSLLLYFCRKFLALLLSLVHGGKSSRIFTQRNHTQTGIHLYFSPIFPIFRSTGRFSSSATSPTAYYLLLSFHSSLFTSYFLLLTSYYLLLTTFPSILNKTISPATLYSDWTDSNGEIFG